MIKFSFTLEDIDAENIFSILTQEVTRCRINAIADKDINNQRWYNSRAEYLKNIIENIMLVNQEKVD